MTVLFGALRTGGRADAGHDVDLLDAMGRRAARTAVPLATEPTMATLHADAIALGACSRPATGSASPFARTADAVVAFAGHIHNRTELEHRLGLEPAASDAELACAAHDQLGDDAPAAMLGDWSLIAWHPGRRTLTLARDATGCTALYWWQGPGGVAFATSLGTLIACPGVPARPDARWVAALLTVFDDPERPDATAFEGIRAVPPGHRVHIRDGHAALQRWWWPERGEPIVGADTDGLYERFAALYDDAVRACLQVPRGSIAMTLSGGLDSGSVAALAAPALAARGERLTAYVHRPRFARVSEPEGRTADEWSLALATAQFVGNIDAIGCRSEKLSPIDGILQWLDACTVPVHAAANAYWMLDIARQASASGATVLLMGQAGNSTVSYAGSGDVWSLAKREGWRAAVRELSGDPGGLLRAANGRVLKPLLRPAWHAALRAGAHLRSPRHGWQSFGLLRPSFAAALKLDQLMREAGHDAAFVRPTEHRQRQFRLSLLGGANNGLSSWSAMGDAFGLQVRDPTRDRRLVEYCWRLPDEVFWAHGRHRGLVRVGLHDRLPPEVLTSQRKGLQSSDLRERLRDCGDAALAQCLELAGHPVVSEWIDVDRLRAVLSIAIDPDRTIAGDGAVARHALRALAVGTFVAQHL